MADPVQTFDPGRYVLIFRGREIVQFADGTFIKWSRDEAAYKKKTGGQGTTVRVRNRNTAAKCMVTLQQTSPSNNDLTEAADLDELEIPLGVGELMLVDLNGTTVIHAQQAWIEKRPDYEVSDDLGGNEWSIDTGPCEYSVGGGAGLVPNG